MHPHLKTNLEEYKNACEILKEEIDLAVRDLEFKKSGKLLYAVDFSEIFAYVLPSESFRDFVIFPDAFDDNDEIAEAVALQQLVLRYIFFDMSPTKLVLLSPYILEFRTFVRSLPDTLFLDAMSRTVQVFSDLEHILADSVDKDIEAICQKVEDKPDYIPSPEEENVLAHFVQNYGYIDSFLEEAELENHPFDRIKQLRPKVAFAELSDLFPESLPTDNDVYERWVNGLYELRRNQGKVSSSELDAAAMNLIYQANQSLKSDTRLILVTRSESMRQLYKQEVSYDLWSASGEYPLLRHPRVFSVVLSAARRSNPEDIQDLRDLSETISLFIDSYKTRKATESLYDESLIVQITKIKQDWKRIQKMAFPLSSKSPSGDFETRLKNVKQARKIIRYAKNDEDVRERIVKILDGLFSHIDYAHDVLRLELQLPQDLEDMDCEDKSFARASYFLNPYKVVFYTEAGIKILEELSRKSQIKTENVISAFKMAFEHGKAEESQNENYDRNLAMAYILGSLVNQWGIAEKYCIRAIKIGERTAISSHEAIYYQAVCQRQIQIFSRDKDAVEEVFERILNLLDAAIAIAKYHGLDDHIVARYWVEKGITILSFHKISMKQSEKIPTARDALNLLAYWDKKLAEDLPLRLFILRVELDYVIDNKHFWELPRLKETFILLERQLTQVGIERSEWPPYVIDLVLWGNSVFFPHEYKDPMQYRKLIKKLREALETEINQEIKQGIYNHIKNIEEGKI